MWLNNNFDWKIIKKLNIVKYYSDGVIIYTVLLLSELKGISVLTSKRNIYSKKLQQQLAYHTLCWSVCPCCEVDPIIYCRSKSSELLLPIDDTNYYYYKTDKDRLL